jgi:hypothetical protein
MRRLCTLLLSSIALASPAGAADGLFGKAPVAEADLDRMRGGFVLPGGLDISIAVQSSTSVNGTPVLTTVFTADQGPATLSIFAATPSGLSRIDVAEGGTTQAGTGTVSVQTAGSGAQVILSTPNLDVRHLAGHAYGSVTANRANDVSIDTSTVINLEIRNATAMNIGSTMFKVEAIALDSAARLAR